MTTILRTYHDPSDQRLEITEGNLTEAVVNAIVTPANPQLQHDGGRATWDSLPQGTSEQ